MKGFNLAAMLISSFAAPIQRALLEQQKQLQSFNHGRKRTRSQRRKAHFKDGPNTMASRYYSRYSHLMTEMNVHKRFAHPFSDKKQRLLPEYR